MSRVVRADLFTLALATCALSSTTARAQIDIVTQEVAIDVDVDALAITTRATVTATSSASSIALYTPNPAVQSVTVDGTQATLSDYPGYVGLVSILAFPTPLTAGETVEIVFEMAGAPDCSSYAGPQYDGCVFDAGALVLPPPAPGQGWYLTNLMEVDVFTGSIAVTVDAARAVVAGQGAPIDVVDAGDGRLTSTFDVTVPTETLGVVARAFESVHASGALDVHMYFADPSQAARLAEAADLAVQVGDVFEQLFGALPFDAVSYTMIPGLFPFAGMGMIGNVWFAEYLLAPDYAYIIDQGIGHELAHTWWGGLSSSGEYASGAFFNEAFAEYSLWRALGALQGDDVRMSGVRMNTLWYVTGRPGDQDHPVVDEAVGVSPVYVHVTYHKGSSVLRMLEEHVGQDAFTDALAAQIARGPGGTSIETLVDDVAAISGKDVSGLVDQFLFGTGYPAIVASAETSDGETAIALAIDEQAGPGVLFAFELPVVVRHADGSVEELRANVRTGSTTVRIQAEEPPLVVELDPAWSAVRTVETTGEDVTLDGDTDGVDLLEVLWRRGGELPGERRKDGLYDPLYDLDADGDVDDADAARVRAAMGV